MEVQKNNEQVMFINLPTVRYSHIDVTDYFADHIMIYIQGIFLKQAFVL